MMKLLKMLAAVFCVSACLITAACQKKADDRAGAGGRRLTVITSLFPVYDFARQIGRDRADIVLLLPPGTEPHSFDPRPSDIVALNRADLFFYTSISMEPWVRKILAGVSKPGLLAVDTSRGIQLVGEADEDHTGGPAPSPDRHGTDDRHTRHGHEHDSMDPHMWLDFTYAIKMIESIRDGFIEKDPGNRTFYAENAAAYIQQLAGLDDRYRASLSGCRKKVFVNGGHFTFGYLARRYGLEYISAYGLSPNSEPTPNAMAKVTRTLRANGLKHVFFEELITPRVAETISRESGAELLMLHGGHNISKDEFNQGITFLSLMEANLINLMIGLQCS